MRGLFPLARRASFSLIAALMLVRLTDEWFTFFPAGAVESIRADLDLTYAEAGVVLTSLGAGGILGHAFTVAADYVDRRLLAAGGALVQAFCLLAFAVGDAFLVLAVAGFLWGAASDAFVHGCEVALVDIAGERLAAMLARVNALGAVGDLLGPLTLAALALAGWNWRVAFLGAAALMLAYALWLATQRLPPPHPPEDDGHTPLRGVRAVLRDPRVWLLALVLGLFSTLDEPFWGFTIAYLDRVRGLADAVATLIVFAGVAGGLLGFLAVGVITRRAGGRAAALLAGALVAAFVPALVFLPHPAVQAAAAAGFGFAGAVFYSVLQAAVLSLRPGQAGTTAAAVSTIGLFEIAVPPLVGRVADARGLTAALALYAAVALLTALLALAVAPLVPGGRAHLPAGAAPPENGADSGTGG